MAATAGGSALMAAGSWLGLHEQRQAEQQQGAGAGDSQQEEGTEGDPQQQQREEWLCQPCCNKAYETLPVGGAAAAEGAITPVGGPAAAAGQRITEKRPCYPDEGDGHFQRKQSQHQPENAPQLVQQLAPQQLVQAQLSNQPPPQQQQQQAQHPPTLPQPQQQQQNLYSLLLDATEHAAAAAAGLTPELAASFIGLPSLPPEQEECLCRLLHRQQYSAAAALVRTALHAAGVALPAAGT
ncbi:hypothetical protein CHLNCDRAFT_138839 [Chlorella variabilis]|uniref:Uncharacterized protein n=1 Tax=Chlorella variabilis TaxID=554065 RepID=E1ZP56_CHLVA|nr:hypothetical protein CHLNCDRAFT_138839 [Chlorella variabilis]EFN52387.1 hypothetical protein CHLNCDRAFT_138839 [Chlorella variabilis]|eukprot:XP_005844489.1 hypothetical protein CHLNCDRAFT_138839 [Chlorella variabilis]